MPRYYVKNKEGNWNIFSSIVDDYLYDEFMPFEVVKEDMLQEKWLEYGKELDSLLTDNPDLNVMSYEEVEEIVNRSDKE